MIFTAYERDRDSTSLLQGYRIHIDPRGSEALGAFILFLVEKDLDVAPWEEYKIYFYANNLGICMNHCHNPEHAEIRLFMTYESVTIPFKMGSES